MSLLPPHMRSWWMRPDGASARLEQRVLALPQPGPGQVLVRLYAAGLNRGEFLHGHGVHGSDTHWKAIGSEGAGEVVALGQDAGSVRMGDRVMGRCSGAFAEYALMQAAETMALPPTLTSAQAAAVPLAFLVAHDMLVLQGRLQAGQWVLVNGVTSGVGVATLQLAKALGAQVIGTSGSLDKLRIVQALGLDAAIATREADFARQVMAITEGHGADLIVNTVGGSVLAENLRAAALQARLAVVGYVDGVVRPELDMDLLHAKRLCMYGVSNKLRSPAQRAAAIASFVRDVLPPLTDGRIVPQIDSLFALDELPAAVQRMTASAHVGKIVLTMEQVAQGKDGS